MSIKSIEFRCEWFFVGWSCVSLGFHIGFKGPHIEIHLPFGFFRLGWYEYLKLSEGESGVLMNKLSNPWFCPGQNMDGKE